MKGYRKFTEFCIDSSFLETWLKQNDANYTGDYV